MPFRFAVTIPSMTRASCSGFGGCRQFMVLPRESVRCTDDPFLHEISHLGRAVEVQHRHIQLQRFIAGHRQKARVMLLAPAEQGCVPFPAMDLDLGESLFLNPSDSTTSMSPK